MRYEPVHYTIVAMDVARSGGRDDQLQLRMRADLRGIVLATLARQGLGAAGIDVNDLGDGVRLIVPAHVTPASLLDPFLPNLAAALREHRKVVADAARLRLRVAIHMGLLHRDNGWAGEPLVHCARLLDAAPLRRVLDATDRADLVVIVSQDVYDKVVRHGYGLDPAAYRRTTVTAKETSASAWVHVPGFAVPPGLDPPRGPGPTPGPGPLPGRPAGPEQTPPIRRWAAWRYPVRLVVGTRRGLLLILGNFLAAYGLVSMTGQLAGRLRWSVPAAVTVSVVVGCLAWGVVRAFPRFHVVREFRNPDVRIAIRVGDLFDEDAHLVVGFTDTFDTSTDERVINRSTVQGQLVYRRYGGDHRQLDRELQTALARHVPLAVEKRDAKRWGKLNRFPVGTVVVLGEPGRRVFAVAYGRMGNDLVTRSTVDDLWTSLSRLWDAVYEHGGRLPVAIPIIGSGLARIDHLDPPNLIKLIILSFVARSHQLMISHELRIMINPANVGRVDLREVATFLRDL